MGFFESFSAPFMMSVALWPLVSFIVTVPVLAMLYHRDNRLGFGAALSAYATVLYLIGLLCFTLYPMPDDPAAYCATHHLHPQLNPLQFIGDIRADGLTAILQIVMNVVFFVPLGFIMKRVFRWKFAVALPVGFLASLLVETMQLTGVMGVFPCSYRLFDVDDLIWNTSGAVIGYGCAMLFDRLFPPRRTDMQTVTRPGFVRRFVAFLIDMGLVVVCATPVGRDGAGHDGFGPPWRRRAADAAARPARVRGHRDAGHAGAVRMGDSVVQTRPHSRRQLHAYDLRDHAEERRSPRGVLCGAVRRDMLRGVLRARAVGGHGDIGHGRVLAGPQTDAVRLDLTSLAASSVQLSGTMES